MNPGKINDVMLNLEKTKILNHISFECQLSIFIFIEKHKIRVSNCVTFTGLNFVDVCK